MAKNDHAFHGQTDKGLTVKNNTLKIITMNIAKSHYNFNLLHSELKGLDQNIILTINESSYFQDLDMFGLCGWRHTGKEMSGLTVYISNNLRAYKCFWDIPQTSLT